MSFARLRLGDWVAFAAALLLLFVMALDWYSTPYGHQARQLQHQLSNEPTQGQAGEDLQDARQQAKQQAESAEKNAWQESRAIDRLILLALLATAGLAVAAAFFRAGGRRFEPPWTPSALAAIAAIFAAVLVAYRIVQQPGDDIATTVQAGAPLAVVVLGILGLGAVTAMRAEEAGRAFRELPPEPDEAPAQGGTERPA